MQAERDRVAAPPRVPDDFWLAPALQEALLARHMGLVLRAYRSHLYHGRQGLPQGVVASWFGLSQPQLSRIEAGPPICHLDRLIHWAQLLRIPEQHLWFKLPMSEGAGHRAGDVKRRTLLTSAGTAAAVLLAGEGAAEAATAPVRRAPVDLAAALLDPSSLSAPAEPTSLVYLRNGVRGAWTLRQQASYDELACLLPELISQAERSLVSTDEQDRVQVERAKVHTYNTASSLLKRLGDFPLAYVAADRAVRSARQLEDPVLTAAAMYRLANVLLADERVPETQYVALAAADLADPGRSQSPRGLATWGGLLLTAAVAAARAGDSVRAWELLGEAKTGARLLNTDHADIYAIFGPTNVAIHGVQIAVELGAGREAVRRSEYVNAERLPGSLVERRGQLLIDMATGHVLEGDDRQAVALLHQAYAVAPQEARLNPDAHDLVRTMLGRERQSAAEGLRPLATALGVRT